MKETKLPYKARDNGLFDIPLKLDDFSITIHATEHAFRVMKDPNGSPAHIVLLVAEVAPLQGKKASSDLLRKILELNEKEILIGNIGLDKRTIHLNSSFWLRTADADLFRKQLMIMADTAEKLRKELMPILDEK